MTNVPVVNAINAVQAQLDVWKAEAVTFQNLQANWLALQAATPPNAAAIAAAFTAKDAQDTILMAAEALREHLSLVAISTVEAQFFVTGMV